MYDPARIARAPFVTAAAGWTQAIRVPAELGALTPARLDVYCPVTDTTGTDGNETVLVSL